MERFGTRVVSFVLSFQTTLDSGNKRIRTPPTPSCILKSKDEATQAGNDYSEIQIAATKAGKHDFWLILALFWESDL